MTKFYIFFLSLLVVISCNKNKNSIENSKKLLDQALKYKDYATAAFAYNKLLLKDSNNIQYKDSLARIYIRSGNYEGGTILGEQVIAKNKNNTKLLELLGVAYEQTNNIDKSVTIFSNLYNTTNDYIYLYKITAMYFDNSNFEKADSLTDLMISKADTTKSININLPNGQSQAVPILAACYNMKGAIYAEGKSDLKNAVNYFKKALHISPDFQYPKMYLERIASYIQQGGR
ncbi:MAG: hypothetical protein IT243_11425 [Bacteroidia bacterium]|nr:hypothetical protein [Bacteroidia bacterium]